MTDKITSSKHKICVQVILVDNGTFLLNPQTCRVYDYKEPHNLVGKMDMSNFKLVHLKKR